MKKIKIKDLVNTDEATLNNKMLEIKKELMKNYAQIATGTTPKSPGGVRQLKKNIARIHTVLAEKQVKKQTKK